MEKTSSPYIPVGCSFLTQPVGSEPIFIPESITDDQRMFADSTRQFVEREVLPHIEELEKMPEGEMARVLRKSGEAGMLLIEIPEAYGGLDLDKATVLLVSEQISRYGSFGTSYGAHTTIGTMPTVYFGNEDQKSRYLPKLATGEMLAAYALTEPGSGSDALGAKTRATLSEDGKAYILNGSKIWITNGGFADLFTVFAKVDGEHFTAFLVERGFGGVTAAAEEKKMGLKGCSTTEIQLENVRVPVENVLGEVGRGHKIAFNILNLGRFKLGSGAVGASKYMLETGIKYANQRHQFKRPIASFGAIQKKIAEMAVGIFAGEAMAFRVAGAMDALMAAQGEEKSTLATAEEFAVECSILKVYGSELLHFVTDETLQIHGGYGFAAEYQVERTYRDNRVNRIFEGTNEINRMLIPSMVLKRTMKGLTPLFDAVATANAAVEAGPAALPSPLDGPVALELALTRAARHITLVVANHAIQKYMATLRDEQQLLMELADLITAIYAMDSTVTRVLRLHHEDKARKIHDDLARIFCVETYRTVLHRVESLVGSVAEGDVFDELMSKIATLTLKPVANLIGLKREVAAHFIERERYNLS